jgi:hypothetical protein
MLAIGLGLLAAAGYGAADFFGRLASRKAEPIMVDGIAIFIGLMFRLLGVRIVAART